MVAMTIRVALVLMLLARTGKSQEVSDLPPLRGPAMPTVTFTESLSGANPSYYSITVSSMGSTSYWAEPNTDQRTGVPEMNDFAATSQTRKEIFRLTKKLHFFSEKFESSDRNRRAGWKSLRFAEGPVQNEIDYTSSKNRSIRRLTSLFESIATTIEYGRRLSMLRADDPTALDTELRQVQRQVARRQLAEFQAIAPVVRDIAFDPCVPEASRRYAHNLLQETHSTTEQGASKAALHFRSREALPCVARAQEGE